MSEGSQLSVDASGAARISGPLTLNTVTALYYQASVQAVRGRNLVNIDLEAVPSVDSSGLALLLEWQSTAVAAGRTLNIRNAPADLLSLTRLCEASDLLAIEGRNQANTTPQNSAQTRQDAAR